MKQSIKGDAGEHLVFSQLSRLGLECDLYRHAQFLDGEARFGNEAPGKCLKIQVKTGSTYFRYDARGDLYYYGEIADLRYWAASATPVIVVLVDLARDVCYWQSVREPISTGTRWKLKMNPRQTLTSANARERLLDLVDTEPQNLAAEVQRISNPWRELGEWPDEVRVYARYSQVVSDPVIKHDVTRTSNGVEIKTPVSVELEISDQLEPTRRVLAIPDPDFKAKVDDDLAVLYAGRNPNILWRVGVVNLNTQFSHVDLLSESLDRLYPLILPAFTWVSLITVAVTLAALWTGQLELLSITAIGMIISWRLLAPRRQFAKDLQSRLSSLAAKTRSDNY